MKRYSEKIQPIVLVMVFVLSMAVAPCFAQDELGAFMATMSNASATLRYPAWTTAEKLGAPAIGPIADKMPGADRAMMQDLKRAIERIVHNVGRPGADAERQAVAAELCKVAASDKGANIKNEIIDLLGYIADDSSLATLEPLLKDAGVREEACRAIQRIPGRKATETLEKELAAAPDDFKPRLLAALGQRQDPSAGPALEKFMAAASGELKLQAIVALSKSGAFPPKEMKKQLDAVKDIADADAIANIRLRFADNLAAAGKKERAQKIYTSLTKAEVGEQIKVAAEIGLEKLK